MEDAACQPLFFCKWQSGIRTLFGRIEIGFVHVILRALRIPIAAAVDVAQLGAGDVGAFDDADDAPFGEGVDHRQG